MSKASKIIKRFNEEDHEVYMGRAELESIISSATELLQIMRSLPEGTDIPAWIQSKLSKAEDYVSSVHKFFYVEDEEETYEAKSDMDGAYYCNKRFVMDDVTYRPGDSIDIRVLGPHQVEVTGDTVEKAEWSLDDLHRALKKGLIKDE